MNTHHKLIDSITGGNDELVLQFFGTFSRFEYALKRAGFVKNGGNGNASPDWKKFSKERIEIQLAAIVDAEFTEAKSYLLQKPPRKQIFVESDQRMLWQDNTKRGGEGDAEYLLRLVRDVRNNLFHGGKYPPPDGFVSNDTLRNSRLLRDCLTILEKCLSLNAG